MEKYNIKANLAKLLFFVFVLLLVLPANVMAGQGQTVHVHFLGGYGGYVEKCAMPDGTPITDTVYLQDTGGSPLAGVPVTLQLKAGSVGSLIYDSAYGNTISAVTDFHGSVTFSVYSNVQGLSVVQLVYENSLVPEGDTGLNVTDWVRSFSGCHALFFGPESAVAGEVVSVMVYIYQADGVTPVSNGTLVRVDNDGVGYVWDPETSQWAISTQTSTTDNWFVVNAYSTLTGMLVLWAYERSPDTGTYFTYFGPGVSDPGYYEPAVIQINPERPHHAAVTAPGAVPADGTLAKISAVVFDVYGNTVVDGTQVTFQVISGVAIVNKPMQTTGNGTVSTTVYSTTVGTVTLAVYYGSTWLGEASIDFVPGPPHHLVVTANPYNIPADGQSTSAIAAAVYDAYGNPVADGTPVNFTTTLGTLHATSATTIAGVAKVVLVSSAAGGTAEVIATSGTASGTVQVGFVPQGGGPIPTTVMKTVPVSGGQVKSLDGDFEIEIPPGLLSRSGMVLVAPAGGADEAVIAAKEATAGEGALVAYRVEIRVEGTPVVRFSGPVTIKARVPHCGPEVGLYYYDLDLKMLVPLRSVCRDGMMTGEVMHLTVFLAVRDGDGRFADVPGDHWASEYIGRLARKRIVTGTGMYRFDPDRGVTRAEVTKMLVLAGAVPGQKGESEGELAGHWAKDVMATAKDAGIIRGYPDGSIRPDKLVTRAELAVMLARYLGIEEKPAKTGDTSAHWASGSIGGLVERGIIAGYPDGTFRPERPVTRAEAAKIIALGLGW